MASNRIDKCFAQLAQDSERAFIPYIMGGDPDFDTSLAIMHNLADNGADILEVGFAFSDPSADGPVIQLAHERVLQTGMSLALTLDLIAKLTRSLTWSFIEFFIPIFLAFDGLLFFFKFITFSGSCN